MEPGWAFWGRPGGMCGPLGEDLGGLSRTKEAGRQEVRLGGPARRPSWGGGALIAGRQADVVCDAPDGVLEGSWGVLGMLFGFLVASGAASRNFWENPRPRLG